MFRLPQWPVTIVCSELPPSIMLPQFSFMSQVDLVAIEEVTCKEARDKPVCQPGTGTTVTSHMLKQVFLITLVTRVGATCTSVETPSWRPWQVSHRYATVIAQVCQLNVTLVRQSCMRVISIDWKKRLSQTALMNDQLFCRQNCHLCLASKKLLI